jgi:hypothetical protein
VARRGKARFGRCVWMCDLVYTPRRCTCCFPSSGELRGQITFSDTFNFANPLTADLSGGSSVPFTPSLATGAGVVLLSNDGTMGIGFLGVSGTRLDCQRVHVCVRVCSAPMRAREGGGRRRRLARVHSDLPGST